MHLTPTGALGHGRAAYERHVRGRAFGALSAADRERALAPEDLECLGTAAFLAGHDDASAVALTRAHQAYAETGNAARAARCAFWIAFQQIENRDHAQAGGWLPPARSAFSTTPAPTASSAGTCSCRKASLLDEVMVGVTTGDTTPVVAGLVYCSVLSACHECFDISRARE
jgi:hypothetical protein